MNPKVLGVRLDMLAFLYVRRVRAHPLAEALAGGGVAIGVALVFGVLLANASLTSSAGRLIDGLAGSARFQLAARSAAGMPERVVEQVGELEGVQVAAPVLRENVTLIGPRGARAVQLIGVTPSLEDLGGATTQQLAAGSQLLKGGLGLPSGVAGAIGARPGLSLRVVSGGVARTVRERALFGEGFANVSASPVAVALLEVVQGLTGRQGRVSEIMIRPRPEQAPTDKARSRPRADAGAGPSGEAGESGGQALETQLAAIASRYHLDLRPANAEVGLLGLATRPQRQSTLLFSAIAVMIGFLLALNAVLLTVPERRRFVAELRTLGYDARQIVLLMGLQALVLGVAASLAGIALGELLASAFFQQLPGFLSAAFPIGAEQRLRAGAVAAAVGCGVLATALASLSPLLDLRARREGDLAPGRAVAHSETVGDRAVALSTVTGAALVSAAAMASLLSPRLTIAGGVALALACACLMPGAFWAIARLAPRALERVRSSAVIVALTEMRGISTRSLALGAIVCLAVYGSVAMGGARSDLLRGIETTSSQYFADAPVWVNSGHDVFNTDGFQAAGPVAAIERTPGVASVRVYRGGLLDVGQRRMWVRAHPAPDGAPLEASQILHGGYATAARRLRLGGWAAVSSDFARERNLAVGDPFALPTPSGPVRMRVAAIMTNSGWPAGAITLGEGDYARLWGAGEAAALEVSLKPGVSAAQGRRAVVAALGPASSLQVSTASERVREGVASARQGLRTLGEISTLLLIAAALSVATALSAAIWQRRTRLAALKIQGYDSAGLWRAVLIESGATIASGALLGALAGLAGHALATRFLATTSGFPTSFAVGPVQVFLTIALFAAIALVTIALPGALAARTSPRAALAE
jgi:putative ABC transport system permease protein